MAKRNWKMFANPITWPNGSRIAACFTWDMDADSILHLAHPDDAVSRVSSMSYLRYGPEIAVPRICDMFESYGQRVSFYVPAWCIEEHPKSVERMLKGGHEVAHHGYLHEEPNRQTPERERFWTTRSFEIIERVTGQKPRGYRAPLGAYSKHSTQILLDLGFRYDTSLIGDDIPYIIRGDSGGELVELPINWPNDDWPHYVHNLDLDYLMAISAPRKAMEVYMSEFDVMWKHGGYWQCTFHPFVSGRPPRLEAIAKMIEAMEKKGGVWFAPMEEIAAHVRNVVDDGTYTPRIHDLPYKHVPIEQPPV